MAILGLFIAVVLLLIVVQVFIFIVEIIKFVALAILMILLTFLFVGHSTEYFGVYVIVGLITAVAIYVNVKDYNDEKKKGVRP